MVKKRKTASALQMEKNNKLMLKMDRERRRKVNKGLKKNLVSNNKGKTKKILKGTNKILKKQIK